MSVDPGSADILAELVDALQVLRRGRSYADLNEAARVSLKLAKGIKALPSSTLSNLFGGKSVPSRKTMETFLLACGISDPEAQAPWLAAWERVSTVHLTRPKGAVRVRDTRPRLLGVHAAIRVADATDDLPGYVPRDLDVDLRAAVTAAAAQGGLVLLVGGSSVGKTRALFEAVRVVLPDWWLVHPADAAAVGGLVQALTPRTVVWLDELQRYLDNAGGLPVAIVRELAMAGVVLVGTLWPDEYGARTAPRLPGRPDLHSNDRELLGLAQVIDVPEAFSLAERRRAEALASDRRIRIALDTPDAGFTQVLAAGPELVRWWENAPDPYGRAIITAALDARRVGAEAPLSRELLADAAPAYLTPAQLATASADWLEQAIAYATTSLHGATATLCPSVAVVGQVADYAVADYLHQHARQIRRAIHLPEQVWQAIAQHHHPADTLRLADSANQRGRCSLAEALYRRAAKAGDAVAARGLAELLTKQGRIDEALVVRRQLAATGDGFGVLGLAHQLTEQGHTDEALVVLRQHASTGDMAALSLANLLIKQGDVDELRRRANAGDIPAAHRLAELLVHWGQVDELRQRSDAGDHPAAIRLAYLLTEQGRADEAPDVLQHPTDPHDVLTAARLAELLAEQGRVDELRRRADNGDLFAPLFLAELLAEQGQVDELRRRADAGDESAASRLADLLAGQGQVDELRRRADAGDESATGRLVDLLIEQGRTDEALATLRHRADAGVTSAAHKLVDLLAEQGRVDELRGEVAAGTYQAAERLAEVDEGSARQP